MHLTSKSIAPSFGDIDHEKIFGEILKDYKGKIDIESIGTDKDIKLSLECIKKYYK